MPRSPTLKIYDRLFLEKLSRSQIQAHAKRHNIKANGKTEAIISQLLGKEIIDEATASTVGRPTRPGTRRNRINAANADTANQVAKTKTERVPSLTSISQSEHTPATFVQSASNSKNVSSYRRPTPYPQSRSGSESSSDSGGGEPTYPPDPISQAQAEVVPMKQTDRDVRVVRRQLTALVNQQVSLQLEIDEIDLLLNCSQQDMMAFAERIENLSWTRQAIEEVVMLDLKDNRHLWDGTGRMGKEKREAWEQFVDENWTGPPRWKPRAAQTHAESDSASVAGSPEAPDAEVARQEIVDDKVVSVVVDEDDEDNIYV